MVLAILKWQQDVAPSIVYDIADFFISKGLNKDSNYLQGHSTESEKGIAQNAPGIVSVSLGEVEGQATSSEHAIGSNRACIERVLRTTNPRKILETRY
jgi:hypothetical protein